MVAVRFQSQSAWVHIHNALRDVKDGGICETGYSLDMPAFDDSNEWLVIRLRERLMTS